MAEQSLTAYHPTWRDQLSTLIFGTERASPGMRKLQQGLLGSTGLGHTGNLDLIDMTPLAAPLWFNEAERAMDEGDPLTAGLNYASMVPMAGPGLKAGKHAVEQLGEALIPKKSGSPYLTDEDAAAFDKELTDWLTENSFGTKETPKAPVQIAEENLVPKPAGFDPAFAAQSAQDFKELDELIAKLGSEEVGPIGLPESTERTLQALGNDFAGKAETSYPWLNAQINDEGKNLSEITAALTELLDQGAINTKELSAMLKVANAHFKWNDPTSHLVGNAAPGWGLADEDPVVGIAKYAKEHNLTYSEVLAMGQQKPFITGIPEVDNLLVDTTDKKVKIETANKAISVVDKKLADGTMSYDDWNKAYTALVDYKYETKTYKPQSVPHLGIPEADALLQGGAGYDEVNDLLSKMYNEDKLDSDHFVQVGGQLDQYFGKALSPPKEPIKAAGPVFGLPPDPAAPKPGTVPFLSPDMERVPIPKQALATEDMLAALGMDPKVFYHGSNRKFGEFADPMLKDGPWAEHAIFLSDDPSISKSYGSKLYPVHARMQNPRKIENFGSYSNTQMKQAIEDAQALGHDSLIISGIDDVGGSNQTQFLVFAPNQIRSVWAKFDPKKAHLPDLMAGLGGAAVLGAGLFGDEAEAATIEDRRNDPPGATRLQGPRVPGIGDATFSPPMQQTEAPLQLPYVGDDYYTRDFEELRQRLKK